MVLKNQFHKLFFFFPRGSRTFNNDLGTVCLSRSDAVLFQSTKKSSGRKNLQSQVKNVTETKLICHGDGESYDLKNVCKYVYDKSRPCTLKNGQTLQLNP